MYKFGFIYHFSYSKIKARSNAYAVWTFFVQTVFTFMPDLCVLPDLICENCIFDKKTENNIYNRA